MGAIFWEADPGTFQFSFASEGAEKILGYPIEQWLQPDFHLRLIHPQDSEQVLNCWRSVASEGLDKNHEFRAIDSHGQTIWFSNTVRVLKDDQSRRDKLSGLMVEITGLKRAEERLETSLSVLRATLESTADGILVIDKDGKITILNQRFIEMWRVPASIVASRDDSQALTFVLNQLIDPEGFLAKVRELYTQTDAESFDVLKFKDGRVFERYSRPQRIGGKSVGRVWTFRDVTGRERAETVQSALYRIAEKTSSAADLPEFYAFLHDIVGELMYAANFYIALYDEDTQMLSFPYFVDEIETAPSPEKVGRGLTEYVLRTEQPLLATPEKFQSLLEQGEIEEIGAVSVDWLGVPLKTGERIFGVLVVQSYTEENRFGEKEKEILTFVCRHIATALERKWAEEALRKSEERYRVVAESANDAIITIDEESKILFANPATQKIFGYSPAEMLGRSLTMLMPAALRDRHQFSFKRYIDTGEKHLSWQSIELPGLHKMGMEIPVEISFGEVVEDGKHIFTGVIRDISDRKRAQEALRKAYDELETRVQERTRELSMTNAMLHAEIKERTRIEVVLKDSEERFRSLFENVSVGVYHATRDGWYLNVNPAFLRILGFNSVEEINARNLDTEDFQTADVRRKFRERLEHDGEITRLEVALQKQDGAIIYVRENAKLIRDSSGAPLYHQGTAEDITERKKIEQQKDEVISVVSHELRTPLTTIIGSLDFLAKRRSSELPEQVRKAIDLAKNGGQRMLRLVNELLDIDKIESGKVVFRLQPLHLMPLVAHAIEANDAYGEQFGVKFAMESQPLDVKVNVDSDRFMQVLSNLLSNAAKFSPPNSKVLLSVSHKEKAVRVSVTDRGPGIPEEFHNRVFQKFAQAGSTVNRKKGSGLGLYISKAIVEKLGGRIGFESKTNVGTMFYVDLPEWRPDLL